MLCIAAPSIRTVPGGHAGSGTGWSGDIAVGVDQVDERRVELSGKQTEQLSRIVTGR